MNPEYESKPVGIRKATPKQKHAKFKKEISPHTRKLTTGLGDFTEEEVLTQISSSESGEIKQGVSSNRRPLENLSRKNTHNVATRIGGVVHKIVRKLGNPVINLLTSPTTTNYNEDSIVGALKEQSYLSESVRENIGKKYTKPKSHKELAKRTSLLLQERILDENARQEILNYSKDKSSFHINHYDVLFGENGVLFRDENTLTEEEKRYALGYTQSVSHLFSLKNKKNAYEMGRALLADNKKFVDWWSYGDQESEVVDSVQIGDERKYFPKVVHHGTFGNIVTSIGFWNRNMASDFSVLARLQSVAAEQELAAHFGTAYQALALTADKGKSTIGLEGTFHKYRDNPEYLQNAIVNKPLEDGSQAKYYSGFIKANNLLRMPELHSFDFDNLMEYLQGGVDGNNEQYGGVDTDTGKRFFEDGWTYNRAGDEDSEGQYKSPNEITHPPLVDFKNNGTKFPKLMEYIGKGTAPERVMNYAYDLMLEDYNREGLEPDNWNMAWDDMSEILKGEINYYKNHGLIKFINEDLGYDGIEYDNKVEDAYSPDGEMKGEPKKENRLPDKDSQPDIGPNERDPSYILFHPWQFKSIYNHGDFSRYRRNFLGSKGKNKYKKVA